MKEPTHASFFSGVGGLDLGLERAGWRTVSFSEIDPYASAVLAERWPGIPNLGDIVSVAAREGGRINAGVGTDSVEPEGIVGRVEPWHGASLWTGGFPCQDLSVAGKRRGMVEGTRSNLAHAFLDLVERHRPPAILLENVPGLLSSHRGRDMATLLGRMGELGYGVAYRILDARHFGVPQRRRRVFILGLRSGPDDPSGRVAAERAAAVLAVGSRCGRHLAAGVETGLEPAERVGERADIVGTIPAGLGHHGHAGTSSQAVAAGHLIASTLKRRDYKSVDDDGARNGHLIVGDGAELSRTIHASQGRRSGPAGDEVSGLILSPSSDPGGVRASDGLAGRMDDRPELVGALDQRRGGPDDNEAQAGHLVAFDYLNSGAAFGDNETGNLPTRQGWSVIGADTMTADDPLLPLGLDSHRYRCCGNGVVAPVAEWIGRQLLAAL